MQDSLSKVPVKRYFKPPFSIRLAWQIVIWQVCTWLLKMLVNGRLSKGVLTVAVLLQPALRAG